MGIDWSKYDEWKKNKTTSSVNNTTSKGIDWNKYDMRKSAGLDTLSSDLETYYNNLNGIDGWKDANYMNDLYNTTDSLNKRIKAASDYYTKYGTDENTLNSYKELSSNFDDILKTVSSNRSAYSNFSSEEDYNKAVDDYNKRQDWIKSYTSNADYEEMRTKGESAKNDLKIGQHGNYFGVVNNPVSFVRNEIPEERKNKGYGAFVNQYLSEDWEKRINQMDDDEVNYYNYLLGKEGMDSANKYLSSLVDDLSYRAASNMVNERNNTIKELGTSYRAGLENAFTGLDSFVRNMIGGSDKYNDKTILQYADSMMRSDNEGAFRVASDIINGIGLMTPSLLTGGAIGQTMFGLSAAGNYYNEAIEMGMDRESALISGAIKGALEVGLEKAIGGIARLGGKGIGGVLGKLTGGKFTTSSTMLTANILNKILPNATSTVAKVFKNIASRGIMTIVDMTGKMAGEFVEEGSQDVLAPFVNLLAIKLTGDDLDYDWEADIPTLEEFCYTGLIGALTAGVLELPTTYVNNIRLYNLGNHIGTENITSLADIGIEYDDRMISALSQVVKNNPEYQNPLNIGKLYANAINNYSAQMNKSVESLLEERGIDGREARMVSKWIKENLNETGSFTDEQISKMNQIDPGLVNEFNKKIVDKDKAYWNAIRKIEGVSETSLDDAKKNVEENFEFKTKLDSISKNYSALNTLKAMHDEGLKTSVKNDYYKAKLDFELKNTDVSGNVNSDISVDALHVDEDGNNHTISDFNVTLDKKNKILQLTTEEGNKVDVKDVVFKNQDTSVLYNAAAQIMSNTKTLSDETINSIINNYEKSGYSNPVVYMAEMVSAYAKGRMDVNTKTELSNDEVNPQAYVLREAYRMGKESAMLQGNAKKKGKGNVDTSKINVEKLSDDQKWQVETFNRYAKMFGVDISLYDSKADSRTENGAYNPLTQVIEIDINAGEHYNALMLHTFGHELGHHLRNTNKKAFNQMVNYIIDEFGQEYFDTQVLEQRNRNGLDEETAMEEVVCNACANMLTDAKAYKILERISKENTSLKQIIVDFVKDFIKKIEEFYGIYKSDFEIARRIDEVKDFKTKLQNVFLKGLMEDVGTEEVNVLLSDEKNHSLKVRYANGNEDIINNPAKVTKDEVIKYLIAAKERKLLDESYIPLGLYTPDIILDSLSAKGIDEPKLSMIMSVKECRLRVLKMNTKNNKGIKNTGHSYTPEKIMAVLDKLSQPSKIVYQSNGRTSVFVELDNDGVESFSVIEFDIDIDDENIEIDEGEERFNTVITMFDPDIEREGEPYDYFIDLITNYGGIEIPIINKGDESTASIGRTPSDAAKTSPSVNSILSSDYSVNMKSDRAINNYTKESTKKYGEVEKAAIEHFGLTDNFRTAGYILADGKMLDFSGAHWLEGSSKSYIEEWKKKNDIRQVDHEDIFEAFDIASGKSAGDNRLEFLKRGNIRISPEAPGIDIAVEPTSEQYEVIRNFLKENPYNVEGFYVDIEGESKRAEKLVYNGKVNAERVINDIKYYYNKGIAREQSEIMKFHNSDYDMKYSFRGENSALRNTNLDVAKQMDELGIDSEKIRLATGWFKSYDGKWRYEINDSKATLKLPSLIEKEKNKARAKLEKLKKDYSEGKIGRVAYNNKLALYNYEAESSTIEARYKQKTFLLGDILKHKELYEAYPEFVDIDVRFYHFTDGTLGQTSGALSDIVLNDKYLINSKGMLSTLIHEIQHQIQSVEGFGRGSNTREAEGDIQDEDIERKRKFRDEMLNPARDRLDEYVDSYLKKHFPRDIELHKLYGGTYSNGLLNAILYYKDSALYENYEGMKEAQNNAKKYKRYDEALFRKIDEMVVDIIQLTDKYNALTSKETPFHRYQRVAGEIEARDVQSRINMSKAERKATRPDIDRTDAIVKYSVREEAPPKNTKIAYKLMRLVDGNLYPLFIGNNEQIKVGTWYNADSPNLSMLKSLPAGTHLIDMKTGEATSWEDYTKEHNISRKQPNVSDIHWANDNGYRFMLIEDKSGEASASRMIKQYGDARAYYNWGVNGSSKSETGEGNASVYALRPGWHFGEVPSMRQIGYQSDSGEKDTRLDNQVWVEVEMSADVDYNDEAHSNYSGDIPTHIPVNRYYTFATNPTQKKSSKKANSDKADWFVAGAFKVNRILSDSEADAIVRNYNATTGKNVPLDFRRAGGRVFNAETMRVEDFGDGQPLKSDRASMTIARIDSLIEDSGAGSRKDYAQKWITSINPSDFLKMTLGLKGQNREYFDNYPGDYGSTVNNYDFIEGGLKKSRQTPYLAINVNTGEVVGHEGRHRMRALEKQGIQSAEIVIEFRDDENRIVKEKNGYKNPLEIIDSLKVYNQSGTGQSATLTNIIPLNNAFRNEVIQNYGDEDADIVFSRRTPTEKRVSIVDALLPSAKNSREKNLLLKYKNGAEHIAEWQGLLSGINAEIKELSFAEGKRDMTRLKALQDKKSYYMDLINKYDKQLLNLESTETLKDLMKRESDLITRTLKAESKKAMSEQKAKYNMMYSMLKQEAKDKVAATRENFNRQEYLKRVEDDIKSMVNMALHPKGNDEINRIPDFIKQEVLGFVKSIDTSSKRLLKGGDATLKDNAWFNQAIKLGNVLANTRNEFYEPSLYVSYDFTRDIEALKKLIDEQTIVKDSDGKEITQPFTLNKMTSDQLHMLSRAIRQMKKAITDFNKLYQSERYKSVNAANVKFKSDMSKYSDYKQQGRTTEALKDFVFDKNMRPIFFFERLGEVGKEWFNQLVKGDDTLMKHTKQVKEFVESLDCAKEVNEWKNDLVEVKLSNEETFKATPLHLMGLYELSKRKEGLEALKKSGFRIGNFTRKVNKLGTKAEEVIVSDVKKFTDTDIDIIRESLTERQIYIADKLQNYMATQGAEWGNEVTRIRFQEEMFKSLDYYPISRDGRLFDISFDKPSENASLYALMNASFTKELSENANQDVMIWNILDVFSNHISGMMQYNAYTLPILNIMKWLNARPDDNGRSVRSELVRVFGSKSSANPISNGSGYAIEMLTNIIKAYNGTEALGDTSDGAILGLFHKHTLTQIAWNISSWLQQPLAITRAALVIKPKYLFGGALSVGQYSQTVKEMEEHNGIAIRKRMGFYDVNVTNDITRIVNPSGDTLMSKISEAGLKGAEFFDNVTWANIWRACKLQVEAENPGLTGDEYWNKVNDLFNETIYKTQVVDSILTKTEWSRGKGVLKRYTSAFMSEPVATASVMNALIYKYNMELRTGKPKSEVFKKYKGEIASTIAIYCVSQILDAAVKSVISAYRDEDKDEEFWRDKFGGSFAQEVIDELVPFNKLPIFNTIYELFKTSLGKFTGWDINGFDQQKLIIQYQDSLNAALSTFGKMMRGENTNYTTWYGIYNLLKVVSSQTGLPIATASREVIDLWNHTVGVLFPDLKITKKESNKG